MQPHCKTTAGPAAADLPRVQGPSTGQAGWEPREGPAAPQHTEHTNGARLPAMGLHYMSHARLGDTLEELECKRAILKLRAPRRQKSSDVVIHVFVSGI